MNKKKIIKYFIIISIVFFISLFEYPYYIDCPGGLDNLNNKVKVDNGYKAKGSINLTYVSQIKATLPFILYAKLNPDWNIYKKNGKNEVLNYEDYMKREQILMKQSYTSAIKYAYNAADKKVVVNSEKCYVIYKFNESKSNLEIGDQIISIGGKEINKCDDISNIVSTKKENDTINIVVKVNNKEENKEATLIKYSDSLIIGVQIGTEYVLETEPKYKFKFNEKEYGPSGGLMIALAVYNSLVEVDITGGKKIAGTGTLDASGNVGQIGGIEYKIKGAAKAKADVFFAPAGENYEEALKIKKEKKYKMEIVEVKSFSDALDYLKNNVVK